MNRNTLKKIKAVWYLCYQVLSIVQHEVAKVAVEGKIDASTESKLVPALDLAAIVVNEAKRALIDLEAGKTTETALINKINNFFSELKKYLSSQTGIKDLVGLLKKESFTAKEICRMVDVSPSYFFKLSAEINDFPNPIDRKRIPYEWPKKDLAKITSLITDYKLSHSRKAPSRPKKLKKRPIRK